jgi:predicted GNAT family N-acyltransferase
MEYNIIKISPSDFTIEKDNIDKCQFIRNKVFIEGQKVDKELEVDGKDKDCDHYLLSKNDLTPVGTCRIRYDENSKKLKIERVCILNEYQKDGLGTFFMKSVLEDLTKNHVTEVHLYSQTYIKKFYEKLGFVEYGEEFMDANIPHIAMKLKLSQ